MRENLIPFPYFFDSRTVNGITYTVNNDGSVTANGTATALANFMLTLNALNGALKLNSNEKYIISGCPNGGGEDGYRIGGNFIINNASIGPWGWDYGEGCLIETNETDRITIYCSVAQGTTVSNLTFKPKLIKVFDYTQPKTDWTAEDYFNTTDYERIVGNIIETQDFASSLYSGYDIAEMMENVNYESVPHADTWNVISENIGTINQHTYNLPLEPSEVYVDNGYAPNYQEFNRWESSIERLMTTLRVEASTIPRLAKTLGRPMIGNR